MKTLTFSIQKGGTGKTSISVTTAVELAKSSKVLLIDGDSQGNATSWILRDPYENQLIDVLNGRVKTEDACYQTKNPNLFVLPTQSKQFSVNVQKNMIVDLKPRIMSSVCDSIKDYFDYCIIDTSPDFDKFEKSCFMASDELIPVILPDNFSAEGLSIYQGLIEELRETYRIDSPMEFKKLVINKTNKVKQVSKSFQQLFIDNYKNTELFMIPTDSAFEKVQIAGCFIQDLTTKKREVKQETLDVFSKLADAIRK